MPEEEMNDFVAFDLPQSASDPVRQPTAEEEPQRGSVALEQLQAYKNCFERLQEELSAIEERHKNDISPSDSEATKELKAVRAELEELKKSIVNAQQQQPQFQQPQFAQPQIVPQFQHPQTMFGGFSVPYMATPTIQPTIPSMINHKM